MTNPDPMTKDAREGVLRELLSDDAHSDSTFWHQLFGIAHGYVVAKTGEATPDRETILEQTLAWVGDFLREGLITAHFAKSCSETGADSVNPAVASMSCEEIVTKIRDIVHKEWANRQPTGQSGVTDDEYFCWFNLTELGRQTARELYVEEVAKKDEDTHTMGTKEIPAQAGQGGRFILKIAVGVTLASACLLAGAIALARHDVLTYLKTDREPNVTVTLGYIAPSWTHFIYFEFEIHGHPQLSRAYWRSLPFRRVDVEK